MEACIIFEILLSRRSTQEYTKPKINTPLSLFTSQVVHMVLAQIQSSHKSGMKDLKCLGAEAVIALKYRADYI